MRAFKTFTVPAMLVLTAGGAVSAQAPANPGPACAADCGEAAVADGRLRAAAEWVAAVPDLAGSPEADRITRGFAAVINRDWTAALTLWKDALARDAKNETLGRGVDLAAWMVEYRTRGGRHATVSGARTDWARIGDIDFSQHLDAMLENAVLAEAVRFAEERFQP